MFIGSFRRTVVKRGYCDITANPDETMENFTTETKKALWHVYDMLKSTNSSDVHISQLKVITSNIGRILGFDSSEHLLDRDGMTTMDFDTYFDIMKTDLILKQRTDSDCSLKPLGERLSDVMKSCWTFCRYERTHKSKALGSDHCLVLWRLFNFFCETKEDGQIAIPIMLHRDEAAFICKEFIEATGQKNKEKAVSEIADTPEDQSECLKFGEFQNLFEKLFLEGLSPSAVTYGLNQLYEKIILGIIAKGMMWKRGFNVKNWKERYLVLSTKDLKYYASQSQKHLKGTIEFDKDCEIEVPPERPAHKPNRFILHTSKKPYEMSAADLKTKHEWVSAFQTAIGQVGQETNLHQDAARQRCLARLEKKRQLEEEARLRKEDAELLAARQKELDEEKRKRLEDEELLRARLGELEEEKRLRAEAEGRAREEQLLREAEQERLRELEAIKKELERLLAEERQAKKDEETVRALQARLLEEEFQKREELERLKQQQEKMLEAEREEKASLQSDRDEQDRLLREAKEKLEQLELDKAAVASKMQEAAEKLQKAENERRIVEDKVKLWKTPVGLARPIVPKVNPHITHRGEGAFCDWDFMKRPQAMVPKKDEENDTGDQEDSNKDEKLSNSVVDDKKDVEENEKSPVISETQEHHLEAGENKYKVDTEFEMKDNNVNEGQETPDKIRYCVDSGVDIDNGETEVGNKYNVLDETHEIINALNGAQSNETDSMIEKADLDENNLKGSKTSTETIAVREVLSNRDENESESVAKADEKSDIKEVDEVKELLTDVNSGTKDTPTDPSVAEKTDEQENLSEANDESDKENEASENLKQEHDENVKSAYDNPIYDM